MDRVSARAITLLFLSSLLACGDDTSGTGGNGGGGGNAPAGSCLEDPFGCPMGQTCWIGADQTTFECLNSGTGQLGDTCQNFVGQPTCTDGLTCLQLQGAASGSCTQYCDPEDPAHACPEGVQCLTVQLGDDTFHACEPPEPVGGSGGGGGEVGGAGGAGGSAEGGAPIGGAGGAGGA